MAEAKRKQATSEPTQVVYVGPTVGAFNLVKNKIFIGTPVLAGVPEAVMPYVKILTVPVSGLAKALQDVETPGTALFSAARKIVEVRKGE